MYNQILSSYELAGCLKQTELRNSDSTRDEMAERVSVCVGDRLYEGTYSFEIKEEDGLFLNTHPSDSIERVCQDLILRKLYRNVCKIYHVSTENRHRIIHHIRTLLNEPGTQYVLRLDVHHFYESVDRSALLQKMRAQGRLSVQSLDLLDRLMQTPTIAGSSGLPRGLNISAALSEYYMKYFDIEMRKLSGVYYYARYVDDIIIFCLSEDVMTEVKSFVIDELAKLSLTLNESKTLLWKSNQNDPLIYLGYQFIKNGNALEISIAPEKVKKIKTRITRSFVRFAKDHKYDHLLLRIKYLTGNFRMESVDRMMPIPVGLYYNYRYVTDERVLSELQAYYEHILNLKTGKLGIRLNAHLLPAQRKELMQYSFPFGFKKKVRHAFSRDQLQLIKNCWR